MVSVVTVSVAAGAISTSTVSPVGSIFCIVRPLQAPNSSETAAVATRIAAAAFLRLRLVVIFS